MRASHALPMHDCGHGHHNIQGHSMALQATHERMLAGGFWHANAYAT